MYKKLKASKTTLHIINIEFQSISGFGWSEERASEIKFPLIPPWNPQKFDFETLLWKTWSPIYSILYP